MAIVESTTIEGPSCPCDCESLPASSAPAVGDGGAKPLIESIGSERVSLPYPPPHARTFSPRKMTVSYIGPSMPYLRLQGQWLDRAGFRVGTRVRIEVSDRRLIMEAVEPEDTHCAEPNCPYEAGRKLGERRLRHLAQAHRERSTSKPTLSS